MSMPIIVNSGITRCNSITDIVESVALEQAGISNIINSEGEKIQKVLELSDDVTTILEVNQSVEKTINAITRLEVILAGKLDLFNDCLCNTCDPVIEDVTITLESDSEDIVKIETFEENKTFYVFAYSLNKEVNITINTLPETTVEAVSLADGSYLEDNVLTLTTDFSWNGSNSLIFTVGEQTFSILTAAIS